MRSSFAAPLVATSLILGSLLVSGCARNAALEIALTLPPQPPGPALYAVVMFVSGDFDFTSVPIDPEYEGVQLDTAPSQVEFSVLSERPDGHLKMVVFFCRSTSCRDEDSTAIPQVWFDFERGTYIGHRTSWSDEILEVPAIGAEEVRCVDRCDVEGCIDGTGWFCRDDGSHYCQERGADPGEEVCDP